MKLNGIFEFGEVVHGPGDLEMNIIQEDHFTVSIIVDVKGRAIEKCPVSRILHRKYDENMREVKIISFMPINESKGWLGITACPICSFYSINFQKNG